MKAMSIYMLGYQLIPAFRVKQMLSLFGIDLSVGTLDNFRKRASKNLSGFMEPLRSSVAGASAGFFDEAGVKVGGETGLRQNPPLLKKDGSWRKIGQTKTVNLLLRLETKEKLVLRFMTHQQARFDNNQSERDLRMNKVRQKVSGGFRSFRAGQECMQIRS